MFKSPPEETFSMKTGRSLRLLSTRNGALAGGRRGDRTAGTARAGAVRLLSVPAIALVGLGTVAAASPGHGIASHGIAGHKLAPAHRSAAGSGARTPKSCGAARGAAAVTRAPDMPWMYALTPSPTMPWMYAIKPVPAMPWMYVVTRSPQMPWMYAASGHASAGTACASAGARTGRA